MATSSTRVSAQATPAVDSRPDAPAGDLLKRAREHKGLTIAQLSHLTKIPQRHLEAIESGNLSAVPGDFYRRAEIRTYARAVNVDTRLALASFDKVFAPSAAVRHPSPAPRSSIIPSAPALSPRTRAWVAFGVVSFAAALGFYMRGPGPSATARPASPAPAAAVTPPAAPSAENAPGQPAALVAVGTTQTGPAIEASSPQSPAAPTDVMASAAADQTARDAAAAVAPATQATTMLVINTEPAGARVTVNGVGWGPAPVTIRHLESGEKRIRVSHEGFETAERVLQLNDGQRRTLVVRLREAP